jgi:hypothetical protein
MDNNGMALGPNGEVELRLEWKGDGLLIVWYPGPAKILRRHERVDEIRVEYRPIGFL